MAASIQHGCKENKVSYSYEVIEKKDEDIKKERENAKKAKAASSDNPMREVMMDRFMPMMESMMDSLMPGMAGMRGTGESKRSSGPTGWTKIEK